ncbi:MAG TPA: DinB family protein [Pyrinomonadaceae bacterium]|nr:DinB family protein [Pyrinomonadaceae bacterium]
MRYTTIAEIFDANRNVREAFAEFAEGISESEANAVIDGESWTLAALVEHVSIVESGISRIAAKLVAAAKEAGATSDGSFQMSEAFAAKMRDLAGAKFEAPERVKPTGGIAISESLGNLEASTAKFAELKSDLENYDLSAFKFPHPYFGDLTPAEWLLVLGGHEARHMKQGQLMLAKLRG